MKSLVREKEKAILLRKKGYSYRDILIEIPVSKSSVSLWLQDVPLSDIEKRYLRSRLDKNITRGRIRAAAALHERRMERDEITRQEAIGEFNKYHSTPFFHVGIALYWAEGSKRSNSFGFTNSDPEMVNTMLSWIEKFLGIQRKEIKVRLYTHKPFANDNSEARWSRILKVPLTNFAKTIYKPTGLMVKKRPDYMGCIRVEIGKTKYIRKMAFWQRMLIGYHREHGESRVL